MQPKSAQIARAHGLPKTHKHKHLLKFRPIIETKTMPYCGISKFLSSLLNSLTGNECVVQDSFFCSQKDQRNT